MKKIFLCIASIAALASLANAQCRTYYPSYSYSYVPYVETVRVREVVVPVYAPYVPVFDSRIAYIYFGGANIGVAPVVPQAIAPVQAPMMPSQPQAMPQAAPTQLEQLNNRLERLEQLLLKQHSTGYQTGGPPNVPGHSLISYEGAPQQEDENYEVILRTHCAECHTESRLRGNNEVFFTSNGKLAPAWSAQRAFDAILGNRMPPSGRPRVPAHHIERLKKDFKVQSTE